MSKSTVGNWHTIYCLFIVISLSLVTKALCAYEGGRDSFENGISKGRAIVLTEGRKDKDGKCALFIVKTLKGHAVPMKVLLDKLSPEDCLGHRFVHLLDDRLQIYPNPWSHGGVRNTVEVSDGWVDSGYLPSGRERFVDFERRMAALNNAERALIDAMEACLKDPAGTCAGLPTSRRLQIQRRAAHTLLEQHFIQTGAKCQYIGGKGEVRAGAKIQPDGRVELLLGNERRAGASLVRECLQREFSTLRIPFWKDPAHVFGLVSEFPIWEWEVYVKSPLD